MSSPLSRRPSPGCKAPRKPSASCPPATQHATRPSQQTIRRPRRQHVRFPDLPRPMQNQNPGRHILHDRALKRPQRLAGINENAELKVKLKSRSLGNSDRKIWGQKNGTGINRRKPRQRRRKENAVFSPSVLSVSSCKSSPIFLSHFLCLLCFFVAIPSLPILICSQNSVR